MAKPVIQKPSFKKEEFTNQGFNGENKVSSINLLQLKSETASFITAFTGILNNGSENSGVFSLATVVVISAIVLFNTRKYFFNRQLLFKAILHIYFREYGALIDMIKANKPTTLAFIVIFNVVMGWVLNWTLIGFSIRICVCLIIYLTVHSESFARLAAKDRSTNKEFEDWLIKENVPLFWRSKSYKKARFIFLVALVVKILLFELDSPILDIIFTVLIIPYWIILAGRAYYAIKRDNS